MRLLALAPTGFFADYGCHVRILGQLQALQALGHKVQLVTYPAGRDVPGLAITRPPLPFMQGLPVGSSRRKLLLDTLLAPTALVAALRFRPDIVHAYLHEGALLGRALAGLLRLPLTFDYQGSLTAEMLDHRFLSPRSSLLPFLRRLEAWIERQPQAIFASSPPARARLIGRGLSAARLHTLPDSVDAGRFRPQPPDRVLANQLGLDLARPVAVYLGLLAPYQGTDLLLEAIAHPCMAGSPAQFLIMGFPDVEHYRAMARMRGVGDRVFFTGPIPYREAPCYLALGDLALAPKLSTTEGSGKLLPYMSMALPIVATDTPAHRAYLGEDAVWAREPTPAALAEAMAAALAQLHVLRPRALRLRQEVQARYSWDAAAGLMAAVFERLLAGAGAGRE